MKKFLTYITVLALVLSLASCTIEIGGKNNNDTKKDSPTTAGITDRDENSEVKITRDKAKSIALAHAELSEDEIYDYEIELDRDFGAISYEIEFKSNHTEYSYDINAENGEIIKSEKEMDRD